MTDEITNKLYANDLYLQYLRYNPQWYLVLDQNPKTYKDFEREVKTKLKLTTADKVANIQKQLGFISGLLKYINSN